MRHASLLCVLGVAACSEYEMAKGTDVAPPVEGPDISVEPPVIDYGLVPVGEAVTEVVTIENEGTADLEVRRVAVSEGGRDGYTVTLPDPLPWVLAPAETREAWVTFTPTSTAMVVGQVTILSDDPDEPEAFVDLSNQTWMICDDQYSDAMPWKKSELWYADTQPSDARGRPWTDDDFDDSAWSVLAGLPDTSFGTADHDVFYRAEFWLDAVEGTTQVEFEGNDGVWLYVNETFIGHWGGDWRQGGCINDTTGACGVNYEAPPADVTPYLVEGRNVFAVMLTNGPADYWLDIRATCVE